MCAKFKIEVFMGQKSFCFFSTLSEFTLNKKVQDERKRTIIGESLSRNFLHLFPRLSHLGALSNFAEVGRKIFESVLQIELYAKFLKGGKITGGENVVSQSYFQCFLLPFSPEKRRAKRFLLLSLFSRNRNCHTRPFKDILAHKLPIMIVIVRIKKSLFNIICS